MNDADCGVVIQDSYHDADPTKAGMAVWLPLDIADQLTAMPHGSDPRTLAAVKIIRQAIVDLKAAVSNEGR